MFRKENRRPLEQKIRKKLKGEGHIMLLEEIYQHLGEQGGGVPHLHRAGLEGEADLEEWEKLRREDQFNSTNLVRKPKAVVVERGRSKNSERHSRNFLEGDDYRAEIERGLEIIEMTHSS